MSKPTTLCVLFMSLMVLCAAVHSQCKYSLWNDPQRLTQTSAQIGIVRGGRIVLHAILGALNGPDDPTVEVVPVAWCGTLVARPARRPAPDLV